MRYTLIVASVLSILKGGASSKVPEDDVDIYVRRNLIAESFLMDFGNLACTSPRFRDTVRRMDEYTDQIQYLL